MYLKTFRRAFPESELLGSKQWWFFK